MILFVISSLTILLKIVKLRNGIFLIIASKNSAFSLKELYRAKNEVKIIGTRHGEKVYESLVNREDMIKAIDMGKYYRIPEK